MPNQALLSYLREHISKGYSPQILRNHLIAHGYPTRLVDDALRHIPIEPVIHHKIHLSPSVLIAVSIIIMGIGLIGTVLYLYFIPAKSPSYLLDLETEAISSAVKPGDSFSFTTDLVSIGTSKRYDINLKHELLDSNQEIMTSKEEEYGIETRASKKSSINIPADTKPGKYSLRTIALYNGKKATAVLSVEVIGKSTTTPTPTPEPTPITPETQPLEQEPHAETQTPSETLETEEPSESITSPKPSEQDPFIGMNIFEKLNKIREISSTDPELAGQYCEEIKESVHKNQCFFNLAKASKQERTCEHIADERSKDDCFTEVAKIIGSNTLCAKVTEGDRRDNCYMAFVLRGDYTVCELLKNKYYYDTCNALKSRAG